MIHSLQKRWVFTWNACENNKLPSSDALQAKLNLIAAEAVFQLERGETTGQNFVNPIEKLARADFVTGIPLKDSAQDRAF